MINTIEDIRKIHALLQAKQELLADAIANAKEKEIRIKSDILLYKDTNKVFLKSSREVYDKISLDIMPMVTQLLQDVFNETYSFNLEYIPMESSTTKSSKIVMTLAKDKMRFNKALDRKSGGGVLQIISIALRISILMLKKPALSRILLADEILTGVSSKYKRNAITLLKELSKKLGFQIIMVTHDKQYACIADSTTTL